MSNTTTIHGEEFQLHHIAPQIVMGTSNTSGLTNLRLKDLVDRGVWDPNTSEANLSYLPSNDANAANTGVARHFNSSHTGYSEWYNIQVTRIASGSTGGQDFVNELTGLNSNMKVS